MLSELNEIIYLVSNNGDLRLSPLVVVSASPLTNYREVLHIFGMIHFQIEFLFTLAVRGFWGNNLRKKSCLYVEMYTGMTLILVSSSGNKYFKRIIWILLGTIFTSMFVRIFKYWFWKWIENLTNTHFFKERNKKNLTREKTNIVITNNCHHHRKARR